MKFGSMSPEDEAKRLKAQAETRGKFDYIPDSAKAVGGKSRDDSQGRSHPDHIAARESRQEEAGRQSVSNEALHLRGKNIERPQADGERAMYTPDDGPARREKRDIFDTPQARLRQHDLSAALRGRMEGFEAAGKAEFEANRADLPTARGEQIAERNFHKATHQIVDAQVNGTDFSAMADRARSAAKSDDKGDSREAFRVVSNGLKRSEGQGDQFNAMADRARSASQQATEQGRSTSKGMEQ